VPLDVVAVAGVGAGGEHESLARQPSGGQEGTERARRAAEARGQSLSAFVAGALQHRLKLEEARKLLQDWESEQGPITEGELDRVRSKWRG
jgi:hypothetical protein